MADLIDRQAMMNAIDAYGWVSIDGKARCYEVLYSLPSIDAEPIRHGRWIDADDTRISGKCSVCGWEAHLYEDDVVGMPYCPNCGATMNEVT